ncbi:4-(cytidine 5'-diphospho)-2-C-methyl-D-erythritol kinase [Bifidobacterium cebidarum]|uniref:4-diphosphocytidyl-2-C-methyl-D-erythritol kinase n=1 Tax=Bifidobacterium cebidarum TaxID=2650773 RepID=A0A6I1GGB6_9BIFI|nr:4-(cytidine 5'-diphospho)-2-C-methyl-D-erythritol kinase [Bifidobacterium cebidarum]KAB7788726.1 4-diphosphocytidyl-2C-methyl-D-erythritol kinase [Bifidobacterium cebidarum]
MTTIEADPIVEEFYIQRLEQAQSLTVRVDCPAKTNLTLEVGSTHAEWGGRHALDTIYCAVGVYDTVTATAKAPGTGFSLDLEGAHLGDLAASSSDMRRNHAVLALFAMARAAHREPDVALTITKRIPVGAGLGGGSADAAAAILAINRLWELNWPMNRLRAIAATLGADMPFCLTGGLAHGTGFGEQIEDIEAGSDLARKLEAQGFVGEVLVGAYHAQLSTPEVYHTFDAVGAGKGDRNHLQAAAISLHPRSGQAIEAALEAGARHAFVSGSGPSVVAFAPDDATAQHIIDVWRRRDAADRIIRAKAPVTPIIGVTQ